MNVLLISFRKLMILFEKHFEFFNTLPSLCIKWAFVTKDKIES